MTGVTQYLLIGSLESYSGKSATVLGIAGQLKARGVDIAYGKPLATHPTEIKGTTSDDTAFIASVLDLPPDRVYPAIASLDEESIERQLGGESSTSAKDALQNYVRQENSPEIALLEGPGTLDEGRLFGLSLGEMAETLNAGVVLVMPFNWQNLISRALSAREQFGDRLLGIAVNNITADYVERFDRHYAPYLEQQGIAVLGQIPRSTLLHSISVAELVKRLNANVLCRPDRLDLMVESLRIGAMNVNSALKYFRKGHNMAIVTGGDRTDIQLAALETSTQCLILTGHLSPSELIIARAEELETPILAVDLDTLTTVEIIDNAFGKVPIEEEVKVQCISELMATHFDLDRLLARMSPQ
ncbi:phosphotransacetylase family protein [Roseofilum casamattae]|uniref:Phosphotransacetylase family protein n=1 Tax=Roseofilum casamattae BLCC-M143 TaxID=3022442 RepID=A0ABT7BS85_9CYAN|nr:phosphotransacetylase family protein [Roseofilum casamattae]MDJ1182056.1 phosphotransacetylase family protein [Roseofilum casamattae BLCC-M143]